MKNLIVTLLLTFLCACTHPVAIEKTPDVATTKLANVEPIIQRIKIATVGTQDIGLTIELYGKWLNYQLVEQGTVSSLLATSWGTPSAAGKRYALMQGESGDDVFLRAIEVTKPNNYRAMTTYGWNAIEIIVEDPDQVYQNLLNSPFQHVGGPAFLGGNATIRAVQFKGPSEEIFYFTTETGDRTKSTLLTPRVAIDRPFIMVLAGPDVETLTDFYASNFGAKKAFFLQTPINVVSAAQQLPATHLYPMGFLRLGEFSNSIEIDGYPTEFTGPRPTAKGDLPAGVSITSFSVTDLNLVNPALFITTPISPAGAAYNGNRSVTITGPAGELIELIEE